MFQKGDQIGSYTLIEKLGRGAFGEVWLAEEKTAISSHKVALKLPNEEDVDLEAIRQEADVWENVKGHPNILPIIKADIYEDQIYIASEYAPGGSLGQWLKEHGGKAPSIEVAVKMTQGILMGLEHLHSKGVIHRDLKPANILLQSDTPRIADFGIARLAKAAATENSAMSAGTPSYMAPECFYSVRSEQTDIWAVGILFHKLLTGVLPFSHPDQVSVMNAILNNEPEIDVKIPESLRQIISKALQKDTALRYKTAAEMRDDLNNFTPSELADEEVISQSSKSIPVVIPTAAEKEEETVVRPAPAQVFIQPIEYSTPNRNKTLMIGIAAFLVLAAVTVWAALQLGGDQTPTQTGFSDFTNSSNSDFNSNIKSRTGNQPNFAPMPNVRINVPASSTASNIEVPVSTNESLTEEKNTNKTPEPTPYNIQPDESLPGANTKIRPRQTEKPSTGEEGTPIPAPAKSPAATPIEIAPNMSVPRPRVSRPTPKPTQSPEDVPPLPKTAKPGESNIKF